MTTTSEVGQRDREELLTGIPVTERRLQLAGVSTAALEGGDGPPMVLLHGPSEQQLVYHRCTGLDHRSQPVPVHQLRDCSWPDMRLMVSQRAWKDRAPKKCKEIPMPLFMDVHETLPEGATVKDVMGAHKADLETQDEYGVKYLRYWVDEKNAKVFCLAEAPNAEAAIAVHREAHGLLADRIYEVVEGS